MILGAVGYETQISMCRSRVLGNGIQLFGGTVNLSKVVIADTYNSDIAVERGYMGNVQYLITKKPDTEIDPDIRPHGNL